MRYYAGIGSRETPLDVCEWMTRIAHYLSAQGWVLRSGGAAGADQAFYDGCDKKKCEIYLPYNGFRGKRADGVTHFLTAPEAYDIARDYHPKWRNLPTTAREFHARNVHQVLGRDLKTPSTMIVCWTADGKASGGTGQALRIANARGIVIHNLYNVNLLPQWLMERK